MPFKLPSLSLKTIGIVLLYIFTFLSGTLFVYITKQDHSTPQVKTNAASLLSFRRESVSALSDTAKIRLLLEDVRASSKYIYNAKDNLGNGLDGIKVVQPAGSKSYVGIYHFRTNDHFQVKLAESTDLLNWTFITDLEPDASQPDITTFPEGDFLVAYEKNTGADSFITVRHYNSLDTLKTGTFSKEFNLDRSLSDTNEGTPNFTHVDKKPFNKQADNQDWSGSKIVLGFHFFTGSTDKNASGTLTDFSVWKTQEDTFTNNYFSNNGYKGSYGDRDYFEYTTSTGSKKSYALYEIQKTKDDWASWSTFLVDQTTKKFFEVVLYSHAGTTATGNPTITALTLPDGSPGYFISYFIFSEGAGKDESGELIFYTKDENILKTTRRDKRIVAPAQPTSVPITCTCTTPGGTVPNNGFSCTDGESRYCAENEKCTNASAKPAYPCEPSNTSGSSPTPTTKPTSTTKPTATGVKSTPTTATSTSSATPTPTRTPTPAPTNTPTPTQSITCTCATPGGTIPNNGFSCTDGYTSYCAENEACTTSSIKPAWPCAASEQQPTATPTPEQSITCTCTTPGGTVPNNGFSCTDGYTSYCAENEHCTSSSTKPSWPCAANL